MYFLVCADNSTQETGKPARRTIIAYCGAFAETLALSIYGMSWSAPHTVFSFAPPRSIKIAGQDIEKVSQTSLRRAVGVVPQDTVLFNDTIGYNIAYGDLNAAAEEVAAVARKAQLDASVANMPQVGFATIGTVVFFWRRPLTASPTGNTASSSIYSMGLQYECDGVVAVWHTW